MSQIRFVFKVLFFKEDLNWVSYWRSQFFIFDYIGFCDGFEGIGRGQGNGWRRLGQEERWDE